MQTALHLKRAAGKQNFYLGDFHNSLGENQQNKVWAEGLVFII